MTVDDDEEDGPKLSRPVSLWSATNTSDEEMARKLQAEEEAAASQLQVRATIFCPPPSPAPFAHCAVQTDEELAKRMAEEAESNATPTKPKAAAKVVKPKPSPVKKKKVPSASPSLPFRVHSSPAVFVSFYVHKG